MRAVGWSGPRSGGMARGAGAHRAAGAHGLGSAAGARGASGLLALVLAAPLARAGLAAWGHRCVAI